MEEPAGILPEPPAEPTEPPAEPPAEPAEPPAEPAEPPLSAYKVLGALLLHHQPHYEAACLPPPGAEPHWATALAEGDIVKGSPCPDQPTGWVEVRLSRQRLQMLTPPGAAQIPFYLPLAYPLVQGGAVRIDGIASRPELNGQTAILLQYDQTKRRWNVRLDSGGAGMSLREECLTAVEGAGAFIGRCLRLLDQTDPEYIANEMALRQHRLYAETAGCLELEDGSLQEWMNQARQMERNGGIQASEIREDLKEIANRHGLGAAIGEALQEGLDLKNLEGEALYVFQQSLYSVMRDKMREGQVAREAGNMEDFMRTEVQKVFDHMSEKGTPEEEMQEMKELFASFIDATHNNHNMTEAERQKVTMSFVERFQELQSSLEQSSDEGEPESESQLEQKIDAACYVKDVRKIRRWLRSKKIHVDYADSNGESLLHKAIISAQRNSDSGDKAGDNLALVRLLMQEGVGLHQSGAPGHTGSAASFAGAVGLRGCKELMERTTHAREMWFSWLKCRTLCDQQRAGATEPGVASCLMAVGEDIFRECIKRVWGPKQYEATMWEQTLPLPTDRTGALASLQVVANEEFKAKWQLNEDADDKPDESELEAIWKDFRANCSYEERLEMIDLLGSISELSDDD